MNRNDISLTIATLYDSVLDEDSWGQGLDSLLSFTGFDMGCVQIVDYSTGDFKILAHQGYPDTLYTNAPDIDWVAEDPWGNAINTTSMKDIFVGSILADPNQYLRSEFIAALHSVDVPIKDLLATSVPIGENAVATVSLYRRSDEELVSDEDVRSHSLLHGHLQRALYISHQLAELRESIYVRSSIIDTLPYAVFGVSNNGRVVLKNAYADRILSAGRVIYLENQRLRCTLGIDNATLQSAIRQGIGGDRTLTGMASVTASSISLHGDMSTRPWSATVCPVFPQRAEQLSYSHWSSIRALVCVSDNEPVMDSNTRHFATIHSLTSAEETLVAALVNGENLNDIAKRTERSVATLRTQLKSVFDKTKVKSQSELVRSVMSIPGIVV